MHKYTCQKTFQASFWLQEYIYYMHCNYTLFFFLLAPFSSSCFNTTDEQMTQLSAAVWSSMLTLSSSWNSFILGIKCLVSCGIVWELSTIHPITGTDVIHCSCSFDVEKELEQKLKSLNEEGRQEIGRICGSWLSIDGYILACSGLNEKTFDITGETCMLCVGKGDGVHFFFCW